METAPKKTLTIADRQALQLDASKDLQERQQAASEGGEPLEEIPANRNKNFKIRKIEENYVHLAVGERLLAPDQKSFITRSSIIKVQPNNFAQMVLNNAFAGYDDAQVIHDPRKNAPKEYALKPVNERFVGEPEVDTAKFDAALAAKEQKLREMEARVDKKIAELTALQNAGVKTPSKAEQKKAAEQPAQTQTPAPAAPGTSEVPPPPQA